MRTIITSHLLLTVRMHGMLMVTRWRHLTPPSLLLTNQPKLTLTVTLTLTDTVMLVSQTKLGGEFLQERPFREGLQLNF